MPRCRRPFHHRLLEAWRAGDPKAGNELFKRHFDHLYAFFRNKATGEIDDLVQQTFVGCMEGRDRIRDGSFRAYMLGVAWRRLYRCYEERRLAGERFDPAMSSLHDLDPSPSQLVVQRIEHRVLVQALRRIKVNHQVVIELYYLQGYRGPQVAEILGIPEPTVRTRLLRGLAELREIVASLGESPQMLDIEDSRLEEWLKELADLISHRDDEPD